MSYRNAQQEYLRSRIESASPIGRICIMCEAAMRFLNQSIDALKKGEKVVFVEKNIRAQNIIREFRNSLNLEIDEKVAAGFFNLYNYMLKQLMQSVRMKKIEPIENVKKHLQTLYESWKRVEEQGLGKDIVPYERRQGTASPTIMRTSAPNQASYAKQSEGLNITM